MTGGLRPAVTDEMEGNSGADRVIALVPPGWEDTMDDARLAKTIAEFLE